MNFNYLIKILNEEVPSILIRNNEDIIFDLIPELKKCKNFNQNNKWHIYDVYEHILHVIDGVPNNIELRIAALFHDIGKPPVYKEDELGVGHFYGHWDKSLEIFNKYASKLNLDEEKIKRISLLILYHDLDLDKLSENDLNKVINELGNDGLNMLFILKESDLLAQNNIYHYLLENYKKQRDKLIKK